MTVGPGPTGGICNLILRGLADAGDLFYTATIVVMLVAGVVATRRRVVSGAIDWLARHPLAGNYLIKRLPEIRQTGDRIFGFVERRPRAVAPLILLEAGYHVAAVAEIVARRR
jgi:lysylphosphatidylglycerol synthetase-like protein (DUF2156 family)